MIKKVILFIHFLAVFTAFAQIEKDTINKLDEVTIKATRAQKDDPFTKTEISKTEIEERNLGQDIPILLNFLPSVVTTSDAGAGVGYTGIRVRGSDATRVNVTINGIPLNDSESQATYWVNLPDFASSTQSMQLQRGVGTSTNGAGAFGASLNLQTNGLADESSVEIHNSFGSFNTHKHNLQFHSGTLSDYFSFSGRLSTIQSDGYVDRASSDLKSFFLSGTYQNNKTSLKALAFGGHEITYQAWYGVDAFTFENNPTFNYAGAIVDEDWNVLDYYDNQVDDYTQTHYQLHLNHSFNTNWNASAALHYTKGYGFYEEYHQGQDLIDYNISPVILEGNIVGTSDLIRQKWLDNDFYGMTFAARYTDTDKLRILLGGAINQYDGDHFGEVIWARYASDSQKNHRYYENNGLKTDLNSFVKANYKLTDNWQIFADVQLRNVLYKTTDFLEEDVDTNWLFFNPKMGVSYIINERNNLYVSYARANKEPIRDDFEYATESPKAEKLDDFELGWRFDKKNYKMNFNTYFMYYKDQLVLTGELTDVGDFIRANSGESYRLGIEFDGALYWRDWVWKRSFSVSQNRNIDFYNESSDIISNTDISYSPYFIAGNSFVFKGVKDLELNWMFKYVSSQYMDNIESENAKLDSYFVSDFLIQWRKSEILGIKEVKFTGMLNNIFNKKYASNGYMWGETPYYFPQAGTNFLLGLNISF